MGVGVAALSDFWVSLCRPWRSLRWWFVSRFSRNRKNIIDLGLEPGWWDVDTRMLHGCMALLCSYVEEEMDGEAELEKFNMQLRFVPDPHAPELCQDQASYQEEALRIYRWWKYEKPAEKKRRDELLHRLYGRGRSFTVPCDEYPKLVEWRFKPFDGEEIAANEEFRALEQKLAEDEQSMLHRLIDIRKGLWT